ncbi:MAG: type III-B CRISPR module RAMP protein Cmr6 [Xanthomonadales bacterium]|nr:type III-B CRISPR module RAMP protein Cmr6 [Xanthomonadales bacterium]
MPTAAVPSYLGQDFSDASPGQRFGPYLSIWTTREDQRREVENRARSRRSREAQDLSREVQRHGMEATIAKLVDSGRLPGLWKKNDFGAREAWNNVRRLSTRDRELCRALSSRQVSLGNGLPAASLFRIEGVCTSPFATGLGNAHPLENGFAFLWPYGLPYLPGSGVKGVLRRAAEELASGRWGGHSSWDPTARYQLRDASGKPISEERGGGPVELSLIELLFGREPPRGSSVHVRGALTFWDVLPQIEGDKLLVEIMNPHHGHYYQERAGHPPPGFESPHDCGNPIPIYFLTVPPGSRFVFHVTCDLAHLRRLGAHRVAASPDPLAVQNGQALWKELLQAAFQHAFEWLGFGAKTAVGYGAMRQAQEAPAAQGAAPGGSPAATAAPAGSEVSAPAKLEFEPGAQRIRITLLSRIAGLSDRRVLPLSEAEGLLSPELLARLRRDRGLDPVRVTFSAARPDAAILRIG